MLPPCITLYPQTPVVMAPGGEKKNKISSLGTTFVINRSSLADLGQWFLLEAAFAEKGCFSYVGGKADVQQVWIENI